MRTIAAKAKAHGKFRIIITTFTSYNSKLFSNILNSILKGTGRYLLAVPETLPGHRRHVPDKHDEFCIKNDESCVQNDEPCIKSAGTPGHAPNNTDTCCDWVGRSVFNGRILISYHQNPDFLL